MLFYLDVAYKLPDIKYEGEVIQAASKGNGFVHVSSLSKDDIRELTFEFLSREDATVAHREVHRISTQLKFELLNNNVVVVEE